MITTVAGGLFGAFCWWLGVLMFSVSTEENETRRGKLRNPWFWNCVAFLIPSAVLACGFTVFALCALTVQSLINLYVLFEEPISAFIHNRISDYQLRPVRQLIRVHNPDIDV